MDENKKWKSFYWQTGEALEAALAWLDEKNTPSLSKVGQGRLTEVYSLNSEKYEFPLVIKIPSFGEMVQMEEARRKLLQDGWELGYAAQVLPQYFPRICMYEEAGRFLIREYLRGEPLMEFLQKQSISTRQVFFYKITEMTSKVMGHYYNFTQGAKIFGGFASANIIVNPLSQALHFLDCGSVVEEKRPVINKTQEIHINAGQKKTSTPLEQLFGIQELCDRRIDFFSYGVLAYEVLFLEHPYTTASFNKKTAWQQSHEEYKRAVIHLQTAEEVQGIPQDLVLQCIGAMHPDVHKRFCGQLITASLK